MDDEHLESGWGWREADEHGGGGYARGRKDLSRARLLSSRGSTVGTRVDDASVPRCCVASSITHSQAERTIAERKSASC